VFDLSIGKLLVIGVVALFLVGPEKLPIYAAQLAGWVRLARGMFEQTKQRMADELGPEFEDVDWASLDPRRYHPKRLLQEAWNATPEPSRSREPKPVHGDEPDLLALEEDRAIGASERSVRQVSML
jgi:sec-independent protein translocase protein TatB